ncbi:unnamed protein product [Oikopleura dioica]|uniref:Uncharacterized protein n=1 Tax=Oikopleura dioica TaxID=34765 RepID=E4Y9C2_OIKDI|nr:unnamed protein product [Oikopleura dioica]
MKISIFFIAVGFSQDPTSLGSYGGLETLQIEEEPVTVRSISIGPDTETAIVPETDSSCTTCISDNYAHCIGNATLVDCKVNEESCQLIERRRGGVVNFVEMGCKALRACENDKKDNKKMCTKLITDKNDAIRPSVCRTCFATNQAGRDAQTAFCQRVKTEIKGKWFWSQDRYVE